jgi:HTH-type transcriptional regulator / antitoxin HigA
VGIRGERPPWAPCRPSAFVSCHLSDDTPLILDDLELRGDDQIEAEADSGAQDALIPPEIWSRNDSPDFSPEDVVRTAIEAGVHPADAAGRWQRKHKDYRRFAKLVGHGEGRNRLK